MTKNKNFGKISMLFFPKICFLAITVKPEKLE